MFICSQINGRDTVHKKRELCRCHGEAEQNAALAELKASMLTDGEVLQAAELFKAFADGTRLGILTILMKGEICVCDMAQALGMTQSAISHQLRILKNARLVRSRREGKTVFYALADSHVMAILACATDHIRE